ncbi:MAG: carboxypeptidase M32 [Lachnospiraceae bacterium]|jgi:carboxypeptidase Taq|nr:carboxypeptidase M32 [Lachnospiraceae bacterium]
MNSQYEKLMRHVEKTEAIKAALTLFGWDTETLAPPAAVEFTSRVMGTLSSCYREAVMEDEVKELIAALCEHKDLSAGQAAVVRKMKKERENLEKIPPKEYREFCELQARATTVWAKVKRQGDYESFAPVLEKILDYCRRFAGYRKKEGQSLYDAMLDEYEESFTKEVLDPFFASLKKEIVPLLKQVTKKNGTIDRGPLHASFDVNRQKEFNRYLAGYLGFDAQRGVMAESEHPFTTSLHNHDVRITNHYYENRLDSAIFSVIHEAGHGIYEMNVDDALTLTPAGGGASCGMHESQSRLMENMIGRSPAFWTPLYPKLKETFPDQLSDVTLDSFVRMINKAEPGLIRTQADELTYCLHVMIRYEIEKELIDGDLGVKELPQVWNRKYEEYLGIRPQNDTEGVLQDVHWSQGSIGYFPSYALGNAFAAQICHAMEQEIDVEGALLKGEMSVITDWLREKVHRFGQMKTSRELLRDITGEDFNPRYYLDYLIRKYTKVYAL